MRRVCCALFCAVAFLLPNYLHSQETLIGKLNKEIKKEAAKLKEATKGLKDSIAGKRESLRTYIKSAFLSLAEQVSLITTSFREEVASSINSVRRTLAKASGVGRRKIERVREIPPLERRQISSPFLEADFMEKYGIVKLWVSYISSSGAKKALLTGDTLFIEDNRNEVSAINLNDGTVKWVVPLKRGTDFLPVADKKYLYLTIGGSVMAVTLSDGSMVWWKGLLYVPTSRFYITHDYLISGTVGGMVVAFSKENLAVAWRYRTDDEVVSRPFPEKELIFVGSIKGTVSCHSPERRITHWKGRTGEKIFGDIVVYGERLYAATAGHSLFCFSKASGKILWTALCQGPIYRSPWVDQKRIYTRAELDGIYAFDLESGRNLWYIEGGQTPLANGAKNIYILTDSREIIAVEKETGKIQWRQSAVPFEFFVENLISNRLYLVSADGQVFALEITSDRFLLAPARAPEEKAPEVAPPTEVKAEEE